MLAPIHDKVASGDMVVMYGSRDTVEQFRVQPGQIYNNKFGHFHHNDLVGVEYGAKVRNGVNNNNNNNNKSITYGPRLIR